MTNVSWPANVAIGQFAYIIPPLNIIDNAAGVEFAPTRIGAQPGATGFVRNVLGSRSYGDREQLTKWSLRA
jgi:hypothetical protein